MSENQAATDNSDKEPQKQEPTIPMVAVPLRVVMLSYNHISYAIKAGAYKDLSIEELKAVVDNAATLKALIPEQLRKQVE
jgi:hypothetical protein